MDIERIPGDRGMRKLPEFTANVCRAAIANNARLSRGVARKGVSRKIHGAAARRASISRDGFFDDIAVDFSVTETQFINHRIDHFQVISSGKRVGFKLPTGVLIYKYLFIQSF